MDFKVIFFLKYLAYWWVQFNTHHNQYVKCVIILSRRYQAQATLHIPATHSKWWNLNSLLCTDQIHFIVKSTLLVPTKLLEVAKFRNAFIIIIIHIIIFFVRDCHFGRSELRALVMDLFRSRKVKKSESGAPHKMRLHLSIGPEGYISIWQEDKKWWPGESKGWEGVRIHLNCVGGWLCERAGDRNGEQICIE